MSMAESALAIMCKQKNFKPIHVEIVLPELMKNTVLKISSGEEHHSLKFLQV